MKVLRVPLLAAMAGTIVLIALFPRIDPSAIYGTSLDRGEAIRRARQLTSKYGVDTTGWRTAVRQLADETLARYFSEYPKDQAGRVFSPDSWGVLFTDPRGYRTVRVELFATGRPAKWELKQTGAARALPPAAIGVDTLQQDFAGSSTLEFVVIDPPSGTEEGWRGWEWQPGKTFPLTARLEVVERQGRLFSASLDARYGSGFNSSSPHLGRDVTSFVTGFLRFAGFCVAFCLSVGACFRGKLSWRIPAILAVSLIVWTESMALAGSDFQAMQYRRGSPTGLPANANASAEFGYKLGALMIFVTPVCLPFLTGFAFGGAGYARARGAQRQKWDSIAVMCRGRIFTRQVSGSLAAGCLWGIAVAAVPYLVAVACRAPLLFHSRGALSAPLPLSALLPWSAAVPALGYWGFAFPMAGRIRRQWTRVFAVVALGATLLFSSAGAFGALLPSLLSAAIGVGVYVWLYMEFDVLAVSAAMMASAAVLAPCILLVQPAGRLRESGVALLFFLAAGMAAFVNFGIRGPDAEAQEGGNLAQSEIAFDEAPSLSNRKRLEAEFQVARKAQQDALPAVPPVIEGYSFSGSCDPATQVGGDLYDLFSLPDGRFGIAVADVSGKGVPAALYMMVTKGLLTATTQDSSDLSYILQNINTHLYRACKRKVFVTMAAIAVDPVRRRLEYVRAGHNPIVWRRVNRNETVLRKPTGLGLGMCQGERFGRSLCAEELDLEPGDAVVLYSDGITEAINASMEQFGEERLMHSIEKTDGRHAEETRAAILRDLAEFTSGTPARDDVTVVVLRVAGSGFSDANVCATIS